LALAVASPLAAQTTSGAPAPSSAQGTGLITGRVFNPNTGDYVRNAQITVQETGQTTYSGDGGEFNLAGVRPGRATVVVAYTGYRNASATVDVAAGQTVARDFSLVSTLDNTKSAGDTIKLGEFVVSSEREGNAKAIMEQRKSMNVTNSVASDSFGDNAEGNVGEFLRNMPGVELDLFYGEVRNVRLRGLSSEYTSVTIDGVSLASADANAGAAGNARAFTMEMASLNSMESIEVSKTVSADVDANAPAGTINLKTKRAFDRAGRRVSWQANIAAHSEEFSLRRTPGPNDSGTSYKLRPGGIFEYSDVFLNKRLGVVINVSESNVYQETMISTLTYNRTPTSTDLRPEVITALSFQFAPRFNKRFATTLTADYKISPALAVSMGAVYNYADLWTPQRTVTFNTGSRTVVTGDPYVDFTTNSTAASVVANPVAVAKLGETLTLLPKAFYKAGNLELEAKAVFSDATSWYNPLARRHSVRDANSPTVNGANFRATRSSAQSNDWKFTQVSGPDMRQRRQLHLRIGHGLSLAQRRTFLALGPDQRRVECHAAHGRHVAGDLEGRPQGALRVTQIRGRPTHAPRRLHRQWHDASDQRSVGQLSLALRIRLRNHERIDQVDLRWQSLHDRSIAVGRVVRFQPSRVPPESLCRQLLHRLHRQSPALRGGDQGRLPDGRHHDPPREVPPRRAVGRHRHGLD
jgi:hypothetical protein